jgi:hypothetical protein
MAGLVPAMTNTTLILVSIAPRSAHSRVMQKAMTVSLLGLGLLMCGGVVLAVLVW